jgi:hypothetical protein
LKKCSYELSTGFTAHSQNFWIATKLLANELHILLQGNSVAAVRGMPSSEWKDG